MNVYCREKIRRVNRIHIIQHKKPWPGIKIIKRSKHRFTHGYKPKRRTSYAEYHDIFPFVLFLLSGEFLYFFNQIVIVGQIKKSMARLIFRLEYFFDEFIAGFAERRQFALRDAVLRGQRERLARYRARDFEGEWIAALAAL